VEQLEERDAAATRVELLQRHFRFDSLQRRPHRPFVFYISPPKTASTTFAYFLNEYLHIPTLHDPGNLYRMIDYDPTIQDDGAGPSAPSWQPDYEQIEREVAGVQLRSLLADGIPTAPSLGYSSNTTYVAFADTPWPFLFRWLDETFPDSKFVFWERDVDAWVASYRNLLHVRGYDLEPFGIKARCRLIQLAFAGAQGSANATESCIFRSTPDEIFRRAYEGHAKAVLSYFKGTDTPIDRKSRFLSFDPSEPTAAALLCKFLDGGQRCDGLSGMPVVNEYG
jgi:hypothetical protein